MLDIKLLRKDLDFVAKALARRGFVLDKELFSALEQERRQLQVAVQELQAQRNQYAKAVGMAKAKGENAEELLVAGKELAAKLHDLEKDLHENETKLNHFLACIPNTPHEEVPIGKDESDNFLVRTVGEINEFEFTALDHVAIGERLSGIDMSAAVKLSGSRFVVLQNCIARLHRALAQFMLDTHTEKHGYQEVYVPYVVNQESLYGSGQLPKFADDLFKIEDERNFYLIPTSEVPLVNLVRDCILTEQELPLKFTAHTPCFRSESGSYGKDLHGMFRVHQFDKVELVQIVKAEDSYLALEEISAHAQSILQALKLPYRVMLLCTGDLGVCATKTYDLEVWLPGQGKYREISSCSNTEAYQARRMLTRLKQDGKKPELVHTLNGSGLAIGRTLIAVLENYQTKEGNVVIPEVLRPYMNGKQLITPAGLV